MSDQKQGSSEMEVDDSNTVAAVVSGGEAPMEVAQPLANPNNTTCRVMASSGTVGSVSVSLHPLVIMNVSEHWTRIRAQERGEKLGINKNLYLIEFPRFLLL